MKSLAISASIAGGLFALLVVVLALMSGPMDGEPFAVIDIRDRTKGFDDTIPYNQATYDPRQPEIAISPISMAHWRFAREKSKKGLALKAKLGPSPAYQGGQAHFEAGVRKLETVPVKALVEYTGYGPLPKISRDGRRPSMVYARPAPMALIGGKESTKKIAILVKGLGLSSVETHDAIKKLPGPVSLSFEPYGKNLQGWVRRARSHGHEILLQVPLEPYDYPANDPGPHTLLTGAPKKQNMARLKWLMGRFTGYVGITNTDGAKFVTSYESLKPVMAELKRRGLSFFDTSDTSRSPTEMLAGELGLEFGSAEILIDQDKTAEDIDTNLKKLENLARDRGLAIGVASGLPITVNRLKIWSKELAKKGFELIPLSAAIKARQRT